MTTYSVDAYEIHTIMVDGDYRDRQASTSGEPDAYIGDGFATKDAAIAAARAWMADHPAHIDGHAIVHHEVYIMGFEDGPDGDGCDDDEVVDTIDADKERLYRELLDREDPDWIYED